jgi:hypothetical protein
MFAKPYAAAHGLDLIELHRDRRDGTVETLYGRLTKPGSRSLPIPVRMDNGAPGTRSCTADFKIKVIGRWLKAHGATAKNKATVGIGISSDEFERVNKRKAMPYEDPVYPLLWHEPPLWRMDCQRIIRDEGLPVPPKSACWFCPFHRPSTWQDMRIDEPALFDKAVELERTLNGRRDELGKDRVWLTRFAQPLDKVIPDGVQRLPFADDPNDDAGCDNGSCWT